MEKKINYYARDFRSIRSELINFTKKHYPDTYQDFNDASVGMLLLELNAAVGDMLSFNIDRSIQEVLLDYAQTRKGLLALARTYGLKIPFKRPALTIVDFTVELPVNGDTFDLSYAPLIVRGAQVIGAGQIFETEYDIDFSSPFSATGIPNRIILPNLNNSGIIQSYSITKREIVIGGRTKYFKRVITAEDVKPFFSLDLPDNDVISVDTVITLDGTDYNRQPTLSELLSEENRWYYVQSLAQQQLFVEQPLQSSDSEGVMVGKWETKTKRFTYEFTDKGFCVLTFGSGINDTSFYQDYITDSDLLLTTLNSRVNNLSLGEIPRANTTMFVKYKVGGGIRSNVGINILTNVGDLNMIVNGSNPSINTKVRNSLSVSNPVPALGGADEPSIEEIRKLISYNFSSQDRGVTLKDYYALIGKMDGKFGVPYRYGVAEINNKIEVSVIGIDANNKLTNSSTNTLKENIAEYLKGHRMTNDYISVKDGKILNLAFEFYLFIDKSFNRAEIATEVINNVYTYMSTSNLALGQDVKLSNLIEIVNNVGGVLNVVDYKVFNKVGGLYSLNKTSQPLVDESTRQVNLLNKNTIFAEYDEILEVKYKDKDIKVFFTT